MRKDPSGDAGWMAASQNARFEEAFNKTRPWNARAYQHHANYHTASGGSYSASVPASTSGGSAGGSFHGQQSSVSSQSSFTSDESNTDYHTTLDDVPQPWTKPRSLLNGSNTSQGSLPSTPTTAIQARATQGLKSLKLGSSSRTSVHTSKQNSNLSSPVAESPSSMPFSSVTSDEFTSPSPIDEALDFVRDLREPYKPTRPKIPFQRSPSENAARELPSTSSHQATLYRSALRRHARNQSTDSVGSTQSDDAPVATPAPLPNNEDSVRFEHRHLQQLPVQYIDAIKSNVKRLSLASNLLNSLPSEFISLGSHIRYLNLRINNFTEIPSVVCEMPSLRYLDVAKNRLEALPEHPGTLVHLEVLIVKDNRIKRLPKYLAQFRNLIMLKAYRNELQWPPKHILKYPGARSPTASQMERMGSDRSIRSVKQIDDAQELEYCRSVQQYLRDHDDPLVSSHSASAPLPSDGYPTFETSTQVLGGFSRPRLVANHSTPNSFTPSIPQSPISPGHIRNASASSSTATARPMQKPQLRSKKSLPELRIGQSPSPSSSTFSTGPTPANEDGKFPALPSPSAAIKFSELHHPRQDANKGDEDNKTAGERNSGAYFKRLSMLPANTASKALPSHLIELVDGIRGILFSLSQVYSALKQFVSFATQERLPAAFTKCLASADVSMGNLINALDRFDSSSRRRHSAEDACQIARDVLEACRENVATYAKLVGVLRFQLKSLTAHADSRYVRTLLLMLYGALGEVGVAWKAMAPHAEPVGQFLMSNTPSSTSTTPSAQHLHPSTSTSAPERTTPTLEMPPPSRKQAPSPLAVARAEPNKPSSENLSARARRHAGSFSTEDVQMGAVMPPAPSPSLLPPTSAITYSSSVPSPSVTTSSNTLQTPAVQSTGTLRPRPTAPALTALSNLSSMPYMDLMATLEGQPPTPMSAVPPTPNIHHQHPQAASLRQIQPTSGHNQKPQASKHNDQQRTHRPTQRSGSQPLPSASIMPPRSASFSNSSQPVSPYTAKPVDQDFFEMAEQTTNVAFSVCNMLVESLSDAGEKGVSKGTRDLLEMCDMTNERARRLANTLESAKRAESGQSAEVLAIANRHLSDESGLFAQAVIQTVKQAKDLSGELMFAKPLREGLSQMAKSTHSLVALLAVTFGK